MRARGVGGKAQPLLQAALNGDRAHPALPRTPRELAAEAAAAVDSGARSLHLHPYDDQGRETLAAEPCSRALQAVRAACPGIPISLSTSAGIEPDVERRYALVAAWSHLPIWRPRIKAKTGSLIYVRCWWRGGSESRRDCCR